MRIVERQTRSRDYEYPRMRVKPSSKKGVTVKKVFTAQQWEQAQEAYESLGSKIVAVKSQIHAGGRGKEISTAPDWRFTMEGGVKIAFSRDDLRDYPKKFWEHLVTEQSGLKSKVVNNLYIEAGCEIAHEYLALLVDREEDAILVMASTEEALTGGCRETPRLFTKLGPTHRENYQMG